MTAMKIVRAASRLVPVALAVSALTGSLDASGQTPAAQTFYRGLLDLAGDTTARPALEEARAYLR